MKIDARYHTFLMAFNELGLKVFNPRWSVGTGAEISDLLLSFNVQVRTQSKQQRIEVTDQGDLKVWINAAPVEGKANVALREFLAEKLGLASSMVQVTRGESCKNKQITAHYCFSKRKDLQYYLEKLQQLGPQQ
ncbi:MAG: DUF167 domain-containing protein [Oligoflexia bacterium]|nr:DUF167 domain-containing protein [Oligoflexia bacterium]